MSCPQIWNIEQEKDREKEKLGGRPAKLNDKKGNRNLERDIKTKNKGDIFFVGRTTRKFCSGGDNMRSASGQQCKVKMRGSEKNVNEKTYDISSKKDVTGSFTFSVVQTDLLLFFHRSRSLRRLALHDFLFCLSKL